VDGNHAQLTRVLEQLGASVQSLARVGEGCPDALVGYRGRNVLVEFKTATGKLRAGQEAFAITWRGEPVHVLRTTEDAVAFIRGLGAPKKSATQRRWPARG
jgi:hypothetical protein